MPRRLERGSKASELRASFLGLMSSLNPRRRFADESGSVSNVIKDNAPGGKAIRNVSVFRALNAFRSMPWLRGEGLVM
jgi:hypothetical protein